MKIKTLGDTQVENDYHPKAGPKVNYNEALNLYMFTQSGQVTTVRAASVKDMQRLITQALATLEHPGECKRQLKGLDLQDLICKWYCIDTLKTYKAKAPLWESEEEAVAVADKFGSNATPASH